MKKIILSVATLMMIGLFMVPVKKADAQMISSSMPSTSFGIRVGPSFSNMTMKAAGNKIDADMLIGLEGGVYANLPIAPQFYIQPSLMYEAKGAKRTGTVETKLSLNYLTLPIDFLFKPEMPNGSGAWFIGVGPYFGYGISGKGEISSGGASVSVDPFKKGGGNDDGLYKRFDAGANVQLGYEMGSGLNIGVNANLGLINIVNDGDDDNSAKNTNFGITLGYTF